MRLRFCLIAPVFVLMTAACGPGGKILKLEATSELAFSREFDYTVHNLLDGSRDTSWVEGKKGDGIGQGFSMKLDKENTIEEVVITNGFGVRKFWRLNNRVKTLIASGKDGRKQEIKLEDIREPRTYKLSPALRGREFSFKIGSVYKGTRFRRTAIAEISFPKLKYVPTKPITYSCRVEIEFLKLGSGLYDRPDGKIVKRLNEPEKIVYGILKSSRRGWLQLHSVIDANVVPGDPGSVLKGYRNLWMKAGGAAVQLKGYRTYKSAVSGAPVLFPGGKPRAVGESYPILQCRRGWVRVDSKIAFESAPESIEKSRKLPPRIGHVKGWIPPCGYCTNPDGMCTGGCKAP